MNEEYMCNYCSKGTIRPLQCNLNEAISLCNNIDCDFYLEDFPKNCLISKQILDSSGTLKCNSNSNEFCVPSKFGTSSLSSVASNSSSTDREVELLLNRSYSNCELPVLHSNLKSCHSFHNSVDQEYLVGLDGNSGLPRDMTHSKFILDLPSTSHYGMSNSTYETAKQNNEELKEMLNDTAPLSSDDPIQKTILDEALDFWLQDLDNLPLPNYGSNNHTITNEASLSELPDRSCSMTLIPSVRSAFSEITPRKQKVDEEKLLAKSSKEILALSKNCKDSKDYIYSNEPNFLSPAGSGASEDSGYNEDEFSRLHAKLSKNKFLTPTKNKISQQKTVVSDIAHCSSLLKLNNSNFGKSNCNISKLSLTSLFTFLELNIERNNENCFVPNNFENNIYKYNENKISATKNSNATSKISPLRPSSIHSFENCEDTLGINIASNENLNLASLNEDDSLVTPNKILRNGSKESKTGLPLEKNNIYIDMASSILTNNMKFDVKMEEKFKHSLPQSSYSEDVDEFNCQIGSSPNVTSFNNNTDLRINSLNLAHVMDESHGNNNGKIQNVISHVPATNSSIRELMKIPNGCENQSSLSLLDSTSNTEEILRKDALMKRNESGILPVTENSARIEKGVKNYKKFHREGQIEVDPWSVPEMYLEELNIEVTIGDPPKLSQENKVDKLEIPPQIIDVDELEIPLQNIEVDKLEIPPQIIDVLPVCNANSSNKSETETLPLPHTLSIFKPISLRPQVINLKDVPSTSIYASNKEPVRLSVGFKSPRKVLSSSNTVSDVSKCDMNVNSRYFNALLSSVDFDDSFLHTHNDNNNLENNFENLSSTNFFEDPDETMKIDSSADTLSKQQSSAKPTEVNSYFSGKSESAIITVDSNDEPTIYKSGKRMLNQEINTSENSDYIFLNGKRLKLCHINKEAVSRLCHKEPVASALTEKRNEFCKNPEFCKNSHQSKLNNSLTIEKTISNLRQRLKLNLPLITYTNTCINNKAINTQYHGLMHNLEYFGDVKKSPVHFSELSNNISVNENEIRLLDHISVNDSEYQENMDNVPESGISSYLSQFDNYVKPSLNKISCTRKYRNNSVCFNCSVKNSEVSSKSTIPLPLTNNSPISAKSNQCVKVSIPRYMKSALCTNGYKNVNYSEKIMKRKYIDNVTISKNKAVDKIHPLLGPNPSESHILNFLKDSGWAVAKCSPLINYQGPSDAITPTIIPPALQTQYGRTGSDVVLWKLTDELQNPGHEESKSSYGKAEFLTKKKINSELRENIACGKTRQNIPGSNLYVIKQAATGQKNMPKLKFSNSLMKNKFLHKDRAIDMQSTKNLNLLKLQKKDLIPPDGRVKKTNLNALKIGSSNIFLPPTAVLKQKDSIDNHVHMNGISNCDEFIELPDDNLAYEEVASDGFYHVQAPNNEISYSTDFNTPSIDRSSTSFKKENKKTGKYPLKIDSQVVNSISENILPPMPEVPSPKMPDVDNCEIMAENSLIEAIKESDNKLPLFLCVAHKDKTYIYHRKGPDEL